MSKTRFGSFPFVMLSALLFSLAGHADGTSGPPNCKAGEWAVQKDDEGRDSVLKCQALGVWLLAIESNGLLKPELTAFLNAIKDSNDPIAIEARGALNTVCGTPNNFPSCLNSLNQLIADPSMATVFLACDPSQGDDPVKCPAALAVIAKDRNTLMLPQPSPSPSSSASATPSK